MHGERYNTICQGPGDSDHGLHVTSLAGTGTEAEIDILSVEYLMQVVSNALHSYMFYQAEFAWLCSHQTEQPSDGQHVSTAQRCLTSHSGKNQTTKTTKTLSCIP